jgi:hypothetical protein
VSPESSTTSFIFAPPSDLMPPCALMWSTAISAPSRMTVPGARIEAGDRHQQSDLHFGRLLRPGAAGDQAGGCAGKQAASRQCGPGIFCHDYSSLKFF